MKNLVSFDQMIGSDGGKIGGAIAIENSDLVIQAKVSYPLEKVVEPATKAVDALLVKLEAMIPGDWDKPLIEKVKEEYKTELVKLLSE